MLRSAMQTHYNISGNTFRFAALWVACALAHGQSADLPDPVSSPPSVSTPAPSNPPASNPAPAPVQPAPSERHWRLGAALGYGVRSNPLIQSEDIPVIVDLDFAWFGKRWFIDNGDVGFTLFDDDRSTTSLVARLNSDRVFFGKTNTRYVNFTYAGRGVTVAFSPPPGAPGAVDVQPIEVKPPDRDYAIEVGIETLIDTRLGTTTLRAFHDASGTHDGFEVSADFSRRWTAGRFSFAPMLGIAYKSAELNDYYWGVNAYEANVALPEYRAGAGFAFQGSVLANYYITRNLRFALSVNYERLPDDVAASPLAEDDYVIGYFSGLAWTF